METVTARPLDRSSKRPLHGWCNLQRKLHSKKQNGVSARVKKPPYCTHFAATAVVALFATVNSNSALGCFQSATRFQVKKPPIQAFHQSDRVRVVGGP